MKKEYLKMGLLSMLIIGCITQTIMLWLGGMLSHNFLTQNQMAHAGINPTKIWLLTPTSAGQDSKSALAYPMNKSRRETKIEYERLIMELQEVLKNIPEDVEVKKVEGVNWEELFSISGIMYEYSIPVNLREITGESSKSRDLQQIQRIHKIFLQSNSKFAKELTIHLVNTQENLLYTLQVPGVFKEFGKIYDHTIESETKLEATKYQPSAVSNMKRYITGNTFMPIAGSQTPIYYDVLTSTNPISEDQQEAASQLEDYVDGFFRNPLVKEVEIREDGTIAFMEYKNSLVIYNPAGTLEYVNIAPKIQGQTTLLSSYNTAIEFIETSTAIPESIRDDLYLRDIVKDKESYICYFDMNYNGYDMMLNDRVQEKLGMKSLVSVAIKGNQVIEAKISLYEIEPKINNGLTQRGELKSEYVDPINKGLEQINKAGYESIVFEDSKAMYLMDNVSGSIYLTRGVLFDNRWYYLE